MYDPAPVPGPVDRGRVTWHISSYSSNAGGSCVEAGPVAGARAFAVRHSHHPDGTAFVVGARQWATFVAAVRKTELTST